MTLGFLGERTISDINDTNNTTAIQLARALPNARRTTLRNYLWNFAKARAVINRNAVAPLFDYSDSYTLPADFIRFLSINEYPIYGTGGWKNFELGPDHQLLANAGGAVSIQLRYTKDVPDPSLWDDDFTRIVARQLALDTALVITKNQQIASQQAKLLSTEKPDAVSITVQEVPLQRINVSRSIMARRSYGPGSGVTQWQNGFDCPWW